MSSAERAGEIHRLEEELELLEEVGDHGVIAKALSSSTIHYSKEYRWLAFTYWYKITCR